MTCKTRAAGTRDAYTADTGSPRRWRANHRPSITSKSSVSIVAAGQSADLGRFEPILETLNMKDPRQSSVPDEPVGIIISRGTRDEVAPRVAAYIWGPVPMDDETAVKAA
jgi:hypothetical protein